MKDNSYEKQNPTSKYKIKNTLTQNRNNDWN